MQASQLPAAAATATDRDGSTALHVAAKWGRDSICTALISEGADLDAEDDKGDTPLHAALSRFGAVYNGNQASTVLLLLAEGADPCSSNQAGKTPLHYAAAFSTGSNVGLLIEALQDAGADLDEADSQGLTSLHEAALAGRTEAVWELLRAGASPRAIDNHGHTALHVAARFKQPGAVQAGTRQRRRRCVGARRPRLDSIALCSRVWLP